MQFIKTYRQRDQGVRLLGLSQLNSDTVAELAGAEAASTVISQVVPHPKDQSLAVVRELNKQMKITATKPRPISRLKAIWRPHSKPCATATSAAFTPATQAAITALRPTSTSTPSAAAGG